MIYLLVFMICFVASILGAICGIGGGVIIKPLLDAFGIMDVAAISFLSGCTVLSMSAYTVVKSRLSRESHFERKTGFPLAIGAACGGIAGKMVFGYILSISPNQNKVGVIQSACLLVTIIGTLVYTIYKSHIRTYQITNTAACVLIGIVLGVLSSFLGIGGGPVNLVFLIFFFSMDMKIAAENSLYIIFFSQIASLVQALATQSVPDFALGILLLMVIGGISGGICGRTLNRRMDEKRVGNLFIGLMVVMILINVYNIYRFLWE